MDNKTIFVSIASYRDPELRFTVDTLFERARYPNRIRVAVCQQDDPKNFIKFDNTQRNIVRLNYHYVQSGGACWARYHAGKQYSDEDYFLQLDSHIAMDESWDELLIRETSAAQELSGNSKVILSAYPSGYDIIDGQRVFNERISSTTVLRNDHRYRYVNANGGPLNTTGKPYPSPYVNAGFMFGVGSFMRECPYDPEIYFEGEELLNTVKAYTNGYDLFTPSVHMCWHLYKKWDEESRKKWGYLHHREEDDRQRSLRHWERNKIAFEKLDKIFQGKMPEVLGTQRTLQDYEAYIGRSITKKLILPIP